VAQCNPVPPFITMTVAGNGQKGTMFNVVNTSTAAATILTFDQCFLAAGTSDVEVYTKTGTWSGFESTPAAWTLVGTALGVVHTAAPTLDPIPLAINVTIPGGATQAFYITSNATFATNVAYTSGVNQLGAVIGTDGILQVTGGVGKTYPFGSTFGLPTAGRLWNGRVNYCIAGTPATNQTLGLGCIRAFTSFYEMFGAPASFDLAGNALTMTPAGGGYVVAAGGAFLPVGSVQPVPTALALGDDAGIAQPFTVASFPGPNGPWTGVWVISNGCVSDIAGNTTVAAPSPLTMLAAPNPGFYTQGDWDPMAPGTGAGTIWFEESASVVSVTWDNVQSWNNPGSQNKFQIQLHSSGAVVIAWVAMAAVGSNGGVLVGYSPGGASANPGSTDLSTTIFPAGNIVLTATDGPPALALAGTSRPVTGTNWGLDVTNIPATGTVGIEILGLADPGINDLGFLGAPGCGLRSTLDALNVWLVAGASHAYSLPIPASPGLIGFQVFSTAAVLVPGVNPLLGGTITANGIKGTVGDV
jgi:hypothetical protein